MELKKYYLPPTGLVPNSPLPVLHYRCVFHSKELLMEFNELCSQNGWQIQWIYRYGETQSAHYHSAAHESMAVLSGTATVRFGVADLEEIEGNGSHEEGGIEVEACAGDVFILPAGVAHKTYNARPKDDFALLTPGDGHHPISSNRDARLADITPSGFTMCGAYPNDSQAWDFMKGGELPENHFHKVWAVPMPDMDPILGSSDQGLINSWRGSVKTHMDEKEP